MGEGPVGLEGKSTTTWIPCTQRDLSASAVEEVLPPPLALRPSKWCECERLVSSLPSAHLTAVFGPPLSWRERENPNRVKGKGGVPGRGSDRLHQPFVVPHRAFRKGARRTKTCYVRRWSLRPIHACGIDVQSLRYGDTGLALRYIGGRRRPLPPYPGGSLHQGPLETREGLSVSMFSSFVPRTLL